MEWHGGAAAVGVPEENVTAALTDYREALLSQDRKQTARGD